jgi:DNA-binding GntR family transcriptional regulator
VRKALQYLETLGAVSSSPNRGFQVAQDAAQLRQIQITDDESDEAVYMRIVEDRLTDAIAEDVSEAELMERHDLTRLQVQRVLNRMAREGLAERKPGRGWLFRPVLNTVDSHRESYRFRMIIEPAAILEPTFKVDKVLFEQVRRQQQQLLDGGIERWTAAERFRAGAEFHEAIVACAHNRFLLDALRNVNQQRRVIEYHSHHTGTAADRERLHRQCEEHLALLDLLEAGERMEASHRLRQHLDVVRAIKTDDKAPAAQETSRQARLAVEVHL